MQQSQAVKPSQKNYLQEMTVLLNKRHLFMATANLYEYKKYCAESPDKIRKLDDFIREFEAIDPNSQTFDISKIAVRQVEIMISLGVSWPAFQDKMVVHVTEEVTKKYQFRLGHKAMLSLNEAAIFQMTPSDLVTPGYLEFVIQFLDLFIANLSTLVKENQTHVVLLQAFSKWFSENKTKLPNEKIGNIIAGIPKCQELVEIASEKQNLLLPPNFLRFFNSTPMDIVKEVKAADKNAKPIDKSAEPIGSQCNLQ